MTRLDPTGIDLPPGRAWCRAWSGQVDAALRSWVEAAPRDGFAVVALGSYARRELCPRSDIDLLLLHEGWPADELERLVQRVCYPLWDAGLTVGYAVRTVAESVRAAGAHLDTATALTDRRLVAGDAGPLDGLAARIGRWLRRRRGTVLGEVAAADVERRRSAGERPGALEPDLKDGAGGLRDLHSLRWAAACILGEADLDALVGARYLGVADRRQLGQANDTLLAARVALHLERAGRPDDRLRLDVQDEVAARLDTDGDALLHAVGLAMRTIAHVHGRTWGRLLADARAGRRRRRATRPLTDGLSLVDGLVEVTAERSLRDEPALGMRAVAAAARHRVHVGRGSAERLARQAREVGVLPWDAATRAAFVATLAAGADAEPALGDADHVGLLATYLPEWPRVRGRPQRNPWHTYDLDTHGIRAVVELRRIASGALDELHARLWSGLADPTVCLLATFLHDIGKAFPGDHSETGAQAAARWVRHMGFDADQIDRVARLVRWHLLLPEVATRRDLEDPATIALVAERLGDIQALDALYLLSLADSRATGPAAWSAWKDALLGDLHRRVRLALAGHGVDPPVALSPVPRGGPAGGTGPVPTEAGGDGQPLLSGLPGRYLRTASQAQAAEHARLVMELHQDEGLQASWSPGPVPGTSTLSIVAHDRLGLVADCAGVLAAHGAVVLEARAFTWSPPHGGPDLALDWFDVEPPADLDPAAVMADLRAAERGALDLHAAVAARARRRGSNQTVPPADHPAEVLIDADDESCRIEVHCADRPGLLSRLARTLADAGLEITGARIATLGPVVSDVFFVRAPGGEVDEQRLRARLLQVAG